MKLKFSLEIRFQEGREREDTVSFGHQRKTSHFVLEPCAMRRPAHLSSVNKKPARHTMPSADLQYPLLPGRMDPVSRTAEKCTEESVGRAGARIGSE